MPFVLVLTILFTAILAEEDLSTKFWAKKNTHLRILNEKNTFLKIFLIGCILEKNIQL